MKMNGHAVIRNCAIAAVIALAVCSARVSHAGLVDVTWSGTITSSPVLGIGVGDTISGSYTYDDQAIASNSNFINSIFETAHVSSFSVSGLSGSRTNNVIGVWNNIGWDQFASASSIITPGVYTGDLLGGLSVSQIFVRFSDSSSSALVNTLLPSSLDPLDFDNLQESRLDREGGLPVVFVVDTFTFSPAAAVPEPASLALLGIGLTGLCGYRSRRKRPLAA